jgi:hypothetical protein
MIQPLGSDSGQVGSTWNFGGSAKAGRSIAAARNPIKAILRPIRGISASHCLTWMLLSSDALIGG